MKPFLEHERQVHLPIDCSAVLFPINLSKKKVRDFFGFFGGVGTRLHRHATHSCASVMAEIPTEHKIASEDDFNTFTKHADSSEDWAIVVDNPELKVWEQKV